MSVVAPAPAADPMASPRWKAIFARLLITEGTRFTDNPADPGGATKYGVSLRFLAQCNSLPPALMKEIEVDGGCQVDAADFSAMTVAEGEEIYFDIFWPVASGLPIPLDAAVFDQAVNDGPGSAIILLQRALNDLTCPGAPLCGEDGAYGPQTAGRLALAIKLHGVSSVLAGYRVQAANRYRAIVSSHPAEAQFLNGWLARAAELGNV